MVHAAPGPFVPGPADDLTIRTLPVFFGALELLLNAGGTTVAEAAFQDKVWRPRLTPLLSLARVRIVHCVVAPDLAFERILRRRARNSARLAHAEPVPEDAAGWFRRRHEFDRVALDVPSIEVDTTSGYRPALDRIVAFTNDS